jgi:hypothetical protein
MRRILLVLTVALVMAALMLVMAAPAFAAKGGQCIFTYKGPSSPPGDEASGGNPGWEFNKSAGTGC